MIEQTLTGIEAQLERIARILENLLGPESAQVEDAPTTENEPAKAPAISEAVETVTAEKPKRKKLAAPAPEAPQIAAKPITRDDLAAELRIFVSNNGTAKAAELLKRYGATRISEVKPDDFSHILDCLKTSNSAAIKAKN